MPEADVSDQDRANSLIEKANALHAEGRKLDAAPLYVEAARAFGAYASFAMVAGDSFSEVGKDAQAVEAYRVCLAEHPDHEQAWEGLGVVLLRSGKTAEAKAAYAKSGVPMPAGSRPGCLARLFGGG